MQLKEFYYTSPTYSTDKGREHDYINGYYNFEFSEREKPIRLLEIGIYKGHSTHLFRDWFINGECWAIENNGEGGGTFEIPNVTILWKDGYSDETLNLFEDDYFDYIIDDGPHTLQSQKEAVIKWLPKIKSGGKLIIEDIQKIEHTIELEDVIDKDIASEWKTFDMRRNKGRWDDIIFEVTKK